MSCGKLVLWEVGVVGSWCCGKVLWRCLVVRSANGGGDDTPDGMQIYELETNYCGQAECTTFGTVTKVSDDAGGGGACDDDVKLVYQWYLLY